MLEERKKATERNLTAKLHLLTQQKLQLGREDSHASRARQDSVARRVSVLGALAVAVCVGLGPRNE